jgi:DNA-binding NarL/FixJ family response regulator
MSRILSVESVSKDEAVAPHSGLSQLVCVVLSDHPLVCYTIKQALSSDPSIGRTIRSYSSSSKPSAKGDVLILDSCSVEGWRNVLERWQSGDGYSVVLVSGNESESDELQMVYLGATAVVAFSDSLNTKLPDIVRAVARGELWIRREVLNEYVRYTNVVWRNMFSADRFFTAREQEIIDCLRQGFSNKQIASALGISERTTKFHVSNVLSKCEMESRRELLDTNCKAVRSLNPVGLSTGNTSRSPADLRQVRFMPVRRTE